MKYTLLILLVSLPLFCIGAKIDSSRIEKLFDLAKLQTPELIPTQKEVEKLANDLKGDPLEGYLYYNWALFKYYQSNLERALAISKKGVEICGDRVDQKSSKLKLLNLLASFHTVKQEFPKALEIYQSALKIASELKDNLMSAKINNNVANLYFGLLDYENAYKHSSLAYKLIEAFPKDQFYSSIISILAVCESKLGKNEIGLRHADEALKFAAKTNNLAAMVVAHHALGEIHFSQKNGALAMNHFSESLKFSKEMGNLNFVILNDIGLLHTNILLKKYREAIAYGEEALDLIKNDTDKTRLYAVKKQLAEAYNGNGNYNLAYGLMAEAHENYLQKSGLEIQESIKELEVKYETEKKEKDLVQSKLILLKKESDLQKAILLGSLLILVVIILLASLLFIRYRSRKKLIIVNKQKERQVMEAVLIGEEMERQRLATELHDGLASDLTAIRYKLESIDTPDMKEVNDLSEMLKSAHEDTRRMSHKLAPLKLEQHGLVLAFKSFIDESTSSACEINFTDLTKGMSVSNEKSLVLYRVGQELIQNALKHAQANRVNVQISNEGGWFSMLVDDDGVGFDSKNSGKTNGLGSIQRRVEQLEGEFHFDSSVKKGTVSVIKIPLN
jgi:two-component system NarL family sensor kinase